MVPLVHQPLSPPLSSSSSDANNDTSPTNNSSNLDAPQPAFYESPDRPIRRTIAVDVDIEDDDDEHDMDNTTNYFPWTKLPNMTTHRAGASTITPNDHQFLVLGGIHRLNDTANTTRNDIAKTNNSTSCLSSCEYYDAYTKVWTKLPMDMPEPRLAFCAVSLGNVLFVLGGENVAAGNRLRNDLMALRVPGGDGCDLSNLTHNNSQWETLTPMTTSRDSFACVGHGDCIYVLGGRTKQQNTNNSYAATNTCEKYDNQTGEWTPLPTMPDKRQNCAAVVIGQKLYVIGGEDEAWNRLKSTLVFDFVKQVWETPLHHNKSQRYVENNNTGGGSTTSSSSKSGSINNIYTMVTNDDYNDYPVPNMTTNRDAVWGWGSVVAIDHYIVVVGGIMDKKSKKIASPTIEILDTQRNCWKFAKAPLPHARALLMAGWLPQTRELIVAGGFPFDKNTAAEIPVSNVESICFDDEEFFPSGFLFKERGQTLMGDVERGMDQLGVGTIAEVLAETLAFQDLQPPFVVGILGKAGLGKTYFCNLMLDHWIQLQKQAASDRLVRDTYAGHVYYVPFNVRTHTKHSKDDVWTSLLAQILDSLNEQLWLEGSLGREALLSGNVSPMEALRSFENREEAYIKDHPKLWETYHHRLQSGSGHSYSKRLLRAIDENYEKDWREFDALEQRIAVRKRHLGIEETDQQTQQSRNQLQQKTRDAFYKLQLAIFEAPLLRVLEDTFVSQGNTNINNIDTSPSGRSLDDYISCIQTSIEYKNAIEGVQRIPFWQYRFRCQNISILVWIASAGFLVLSFVLFEFLKDPIQQYASTAIAGLVAGTLPMLSAIVVAVRQTHRVLDDLKRDIGDSDDDVEAGSHSSDSVLRDYQTERAEILNRTRTLRGFLLSDPLSKIDPNSYKNDRIGAIRSVQQDLHKLSHSMLGKDKRNLFPRGDPRILLVIDELDRCPSATIVEIVEALEVLVKTKLFVVVLAVDPDRASLSLEKEFHHGTKSSSEALDCLEKAIQIPFRLSGICPNDANAFVDQQMEYSNATRPQQPDNDDDMGFGISGIVDIPSAISTAIPNLPSALSNAFTTFSFGNESSQSSHQSTLSLDDRLPREKIGFTASEVAMIRDVLGVFQTGPRCTKRIINIFKLMKVVWKRDQGNRFLESDDLKRATFLLVLLASGKSTRAATQRVFGWMEGGIVSYHHAMLRNEKGLPWAEHNLASLLARELQVNDKGFVFSSSDEAIDQGTVMAHIRDSLLQYTYKNCQEWNALSSQFLLARCFSFVRLGSSRDISPVAAGASGDETWKDFLEFEI